jgi:glycosyltransferase involved in cell wall biosynthesis
MKKSCPKNKNDQSLKIFVTGTRGIPNILGGVETICQELYPCIVASGHDVYLCTRSSYIKEKIDAWRGVKLINCFAPRKKSLEAIFHTFISLLKARLYSPDVVHIHAIGPALLTPFARLMGLKVVVTSQGPDYDRQKWDKVAKFMLRLGEKMAGLYANEVIVVSPVIAEIMHKRCHRECNIIYNGVSLPELSSRTDFLTQMGVKKNRYLLAVARFVPEKGLHDLINAFKAIKCDSKLVIAGDADHETKYSRSLWKMSDEDDRIIFTGFITGDRLNQVFSHAQLFVLPSYHEGLPLALLEAMSYGLPVLVSDIPANLEVDLPAERYFKCGDEADLATKMEALLKKGLPEIEKRDMRLQIAEKYNWLKIAEQTVEVYRKALKKR